MIKDDYNHKPIGLSPGSVVYDGRKCEEEVKIHLIEYNEKELVEREFTNLNECLFHLNPNMVQWINVDGIHKADLIESLGKRFNIHSLTLEDIVSTKGRPKIEEYDSYLFAMLKMIYTFPDREIRFEHLSIVLLENNIIISFQEALGDVFDPVRERIRKGKARVRRLGADYLMYCLLDAVVDNYFVVMEEKGDQIESLEEELIRNPTKDTLGKLHYLKREIILLRKNILPVRELINNLDKTENVLINRATHVFIRDLYDHAFRIIDTIETYRDLLAGMMDIYLSSVSNKMNEVMKVLTIITTIFVPITFIVGVYGMNFDIPEVKSQHGYAIVWTVMITIAGLLIYYFKKKKWL
jgi:magnesium transporter